LQHEIKSTAIAIGRGNTIILEGTILEVTTNGDRMRNTVGL
jgi:hypothetical protein